MNIVVIGMGYVGIPCAVLLADVPTGTTVRPLATNLWFALRTGVAVAEKVV